MTVGLVGGQPTHAAEPAAWIAACDGGSVVGVHPDPPREHAMPGRHPTNPIRSKKALGMILGAVIALAAPSLASAAEVERSGDNLFFYSAAGENNDVKVNLSVPGH